MKEIIKQELKRLETNGLSLAWYMLEGTEYEELVKDEIAKRRAKAFFENCPRFA